MSIMTSPDREAMANRRSTSLARVGLLLLSFACQSPVTSTHKATKRTAAKKTAKAAAKKPSAENRASIERRVAKRAGRKSSSFCAAQFPLCRRNGASDKQGKRPSGAKCRIVLIKHAGTSMVERPIQRCRCPSEDHGHKPRKCNNLATERDQLCKPYSEREIAEPEAKTTTGHG